MKQKEIFMFKHLQFRQAHSYVPPISLQHLPIAIVGDNIGMVLKTDGDLDTTSSLGGHDITQFLSVIKACPSSHSYFSSAY